MTVSKVENKNSNQVVIKKQKFKLDFTKIDGATNVKEDSSVEVTHNMINVDKFRMNPRQHTSLLENAMSMLDLSKDKHNEVGLGD